ncbi:MAG: ATP-dependent DNA helicase [Bryobacteraceae bacterium]|nr:ATP-dependent DNA helicase [Bryobacteraceae bacterium]
MEGAQSLTAREFFRKNGVLSEWHPNYEFRPAQLEMAEAVEQALKDRRHLIVEAGTGTGKTLAYLVPAILSGRRVVVSTGTKNLQEQLYFKDIPFLQKHIERPLRVCLMKGRANYICRQKVYDAEKEPVLEGLEEVTDFRVIQEWEKRTTTGDRAELTALPEASRLWEKLDARRDRCTGQKCPQFERCFLTELQRKAHESDIIVVNHHLFFADLAVKQDDFGGIIPHYAAVVFDEAHEVEDVAGGYFGVSISNFQIEDLVRDVTALARAKGFSSPELDRALIVLGDRSAAFFALFGEQEGRQGFSRQAGFLALHGEAYEAVLLALELVATHLQLNKTAVEEIAPLVRRAAEIADKLKVWMQSGDEKFVYWIEKRGRGRFLQATPIDVSSLLTEKLFEQIDTIVLTSATLAVAGTFEYVEKRLGLKQARTLAVDAPFDYAKQALLYIPQHLPDPRNAAFASLAAKEVAAILKHSRGRAFVLFTSHAQMRTVHDAVKPIIDYPALLQGTAPRHALLDRFRATPNCVLFATSAFWQGVDVQGERLSCVIIDKLPFAVPSDPVVEARIRAIRDSGGGPFAEYQVPDAALTLKQGFGRLIRSRTDRGVLVLLDHRITRTRYGQMFFDSLPPYAFTTKIEDVGKFFEGPS